MATAPDWMRWLKEGEIAPTDTRSVGDPQTQTP
jgi:hypothetical protein